MKRGKKKNGMYEINSEAFSAFYVGPGADMKNERAKGKNGGTHSAQPATESLNMNDDDTPKKKQRTRRLK